ncbi:Inner membrane protein yjcH [Citrobacter freundii]|nr:Inner membrane protein yjcH [Citrobacter freundii]
MNDSIYQRIEDSARFRELVEKRQRFATILSIIMLAVYISFILLDCFCAWLAGYAATRGNQRHPGYSDWGRCDPHLFHPDWDLYLAGKR